MFSRVLISSFWLRLFLQLPHWYGGLSWSHPIRTLLIRTVQTLLGCTQAHKTEFGFTPRAHQTSAVLLVVFQQNAAFGTSADGGTVANALHLFKVDVRTRGQDVQRTLAANVVAAIRAGGWTFPFLHALPTECIRRAFLCRARRALHAEVVAVLSAHQTVTAGTLERQIVITVYTAQPLFLGMMRATFKSQLGLGSLWSLILSNHKGEKGNFGRFFNKVLIRPPN